MPKVKADLNTKDCFILNLRKDKYVTNSALKP